jgi:hypothetical protein
VSISKQHRSYAQMSARLSTVFPRACSGDMYAAVPSIIPACVIAGVVIGGNIEKPGDEPAPGSIALPQRAKSSCGTARTLRMWDFDSPRRLL